MKFLRPLTSSDSLILPIIFLSFNYIDSQILLSK